MYVDPPLVLGPTYSSRGHIHGPPPQILAVFWLCPCVHVPGNCPGNEVLAGVCQLEILGGAGENVTYHVPRPKLHFLPPLENQ